jgi:hypothetical protein
MAEGLRGYEQSRVMVGAYGTCKQNSNQNTGDNSLRDPRLSSELTTGDLAALLGDAVQALLANGAGVLAADGGLLGEAGLTLTLVLLGANVLNENALVLELVTLSLEVKLVVEVRVDLAGVAVLGEEAAENALAADPQNLGGHAGLTGTLTLTGTRVATEALGGKPAADGRARVHDGGLLDNNTGVNEGADGGARVGGGDVGDLGGVHPDLALTALEDRGREALLELEVRHLGEKLEME